MMEWIVVLVSAWLLGSFSTMLVYRIPREIPLGLFSHFRSRCTHCDKVIPWYENFPVFSYLYLRGKCSKCERKIGLHYFLIEVSTIFFFALTYFIFVKANLLEILGPTYGYLELGKLLFFTLALVVTTFIDVEFRIIPDRFSLGCWPVALLAAYLWQQPPFLDALLGGLLGFGLFLGISWFYEKWRKIEGLGMGDVKMMGWLGSWVGVLGVSRVIFLASALGLLVGIYFMIKSKKGLKTAIPFGPFLAVAAYIVWALQILEIL